MTEHMDPYDAQQELLQEEWLAERAAMQKLVTKWLDELGVLCDCDNGMRQISPANITNASYGYDRCRQCTLVEVGGIRVRYVRQADETAVVLPAVGVTDE